MPHHICRQVVFAVAQTFLRYSPIQITSKSMLHTYSPQIGYSTMGIYQILESMKKAEKKGDLRRVLSVNVV